MSNITWLLLTCDGANTPGVTGAGAGVFDVSDSAGVVVTGGGGTTTATGVDGVCGVLGALTVEVAGADTVVRPFPFFWGGCNSIS